MTRTDTRLGSEPAVRRPSNSSSGDHRLRLFLWKHERPWTLLRLSLFPPESADPGTNRGNLRQRDELPEESADGRVLEGLHAEPERPALFWVSLKVDLGVKGEEDERTD